MGRRKKLLFRVLSIAIGLSPFLLIEAVLRIVDRPRSVVRTDPLLDLHALRPLFTKSDDGQRMLIGPERWNWFCKDQFPVTKDVKTFRVFVLGGSTVQGRPYQIESAFSSWLRLWLEAAEPERSWEVVNCGGVSYASYRVAAIVDEVLDYEPDLVIIYTGHNEFLEQRTYENWKQVPRSVAASLEFFADWKLVQAGRLLLPKRNDSPIAADALPSEVLARLDRPGGLDLFHRDDNWRGKVLEHYRLTLASMLRACRKAKVPAVLCVPVSNLRDMPPFKIEIDPSLSPELQARCAALWNQITGGEMNPDPLNSTTRSTLCRQLLAIDPHHAGANYVLGTTLLEDSDGFSASAYLEAACDWDVCPLRMPSELMDFVREIGPQYDAPVVDVQRRIASVSRDGIPGDDWLIDHVHPTIAGHQKIAEAIFKTMVNEGWVSPKADTMGRYSSVAKNYHDRVLNEAYYQRGQQRLSALRLWTQGRVDALE